MERRRRGRAVGSDAVDIGILEWGFVGGIAGEM